MFFKNIPWCVLNVYQKGISGTVYAPLNKVVCLFHLKQPMWWFEVTLVVLENFTDNSVFLTLKSISTFQAFFDKAGLH